MIYFINTLVTMLANLTLIGGGGYVIYKTSNHFFPQKTNQVLCNVGWTSINSYTKIKKNYIKHVWPIYKTHILKPTYKLLGYSLTEDNSIILVKDGKEISKYKDFPDLYDNEDIDSCDFILQIYHDNDNDNNSKKNYTVKHNELIEKEDITTLKFNTSTCSFIAIELKYNNKSYTIDLKKPNNFLIENNELLDYSFLKWYIKKNYKFDLSSNYTLEIVDSNVETKNLRNNQSIKILSDSWEIEEYQVSDSEDYDSTGDSNETVYTSIYSYFFATKKDNKEK